MIELDVPSHLPSSEFTSIIDGSLQTFKLNYVDRTESWYLTISNSLGTIISNVKIVPFVNLLRRNPDIAPSGGLSAISRTFAKAPIGRNNFGIGKEWNLCYFTEDELI